MSYAHIANKVLHAKENGISVDRIHQLAPNNTGDANQKPEASNQKPDPTEE